MTGYGHVLVLLVFVFICSSFANVEPKAHENISKIGQKRIDVQGMNNINSFLVNKPLFSIGNLSVKQRLHESIIYQVQTDFKLVLL